MQLNLTFLEMPNPTALVWDKLDEENRFVVLEMLARLIAQAAQAELSAEGNDHD